MKSTSQNFKIKSKSTAAALQALSQITNNISKRCGLSTEQITRSIMGDDKMSHEGLINTREAAKFLGLSTKTLANWRVSGKFNLPYTKIGERVFYKTSDLMDFVNSNSKQSTSSKLNVSSTYKNVQ
ncbi:MAG: helix-turn-helix domain-containing protein [Hyphomicrobiales bacterium]